VVFVDEEDPHINELGAKGIGGLGLTGVVATIGNAISSATGKHVRDLPITIDKLLQASVDAHPATRPHHHPRGVGKPAGVR
jgi:xanthine dehydrogenase YagR molybdenum-binding subunit